MRKITIDEEFRSLLPPLSKEAYASLEENLMQNGCRDSLVLWNDTLIDGHNRYEICTKHGIPFDIFNKEFGTREEVLAWIVSSQVSRRNLTSDQLSSYIRLHHGTKLDKAISKATNDVTEGLPEIMKKADNTKLQKALRAYINTLEDLYGKI